MEYKLHADLINAILKYLGTRPYAEIFQLIAAIHSACKPQEQPEPQKPAELVEPAKS